MRSPTAATQAGHRGGAGLVLWVLWLSYGCFYFCRNNLAVALPGMAEELGHDKARLGTVLMALKLAYGAGQLVNGQLAERVPARVLLAAGMLGSAALNVAFGAAAAFELLVFIWAANGYFQALGWTPTMRVATRWFPPERRGRAIGLIGTGYQLGGALTFVVAGWAAERFGWRGALWVPAIVLGAAAVHMLVFLREAPPEPDGAPAAPAAPGAWLGTLRATLANRALWLIAISLCLLDACRYGFTDWGVLHLREVQGASVGTAALKYAVLPLGGMAGALASGWATDRWFAGRRAPVLCALLLALAALAAIYPRVVHLGLLPSITVLFLVGFCIFGPQVLLVGTFPADVARGGNAAAAVGFVNFMGYMGAAAGDSLTGHLAQRAGWQVAVAFWAACALGAAAAAAPLWRTSAARRG